MRTIFAKQIYRISSQTGGGGLIFSENLHQAGLEPARQAAVIAKRHVTIPLWSISKRQYCHHKICWSNIGLMLVKLRRRFCFTGNIFFQCDRNSPCAGRSAHLQYYEMQGHTVVTAHFCKNNAADDGLCALWYECAVDSCTTQCGAVDPEIRFTR